MISSLRVARVALVGLCGLMGLSGCSIVVGGVLNGKPADADAGMAPACTTDGNCSDLNMCNTDRCFEGRCIHEPALEGMPCGSSGMCSDGTCRPCPPAGCIDPCAGISCTGGQTCVGGMCRDVCTPPCTGVQTCVGNTCMDGPALCGNGVLERDRGEQCDPPDADRCLPDCLLRCTTDAECDDTDVCTADKCILADMSCSYSPTDLDGDGYYPTACAGDDCKDTDANIHPGGVEICNFEDDDCNGTADDGIASAVWYRDSDLDGYGDPGFSVSSPGCEFPMGFVANMLDCNDIYPIVHPYPIGETPGFYDVDRGDGSFDYDCDGVETPEYGYLSCAMGGTSTCTGGASCTGSAGVTVAPVCGQFAEIYACDPCTDAGGMCMWTSVRTIANLACQ